MKNYTSLFAVLLASAGLLEGQKIVDPSQSNESIRAIESRFYIGFAYLTPLPELLKLPQNIASNSIVVAHTVMDHNRVGGSSTDPYVWLATYVGNSDAIVIGRPYNRVSSLTSEKTFVFSDYEFEIQSILKDTTKHLATSSQIIITRPGGVIDYEGRSFRAIDPEFQLFRTGELYVFFLKRIPETGTYMAYSHSAFTLGNGYVTPARTHPEHPLHNITTEDFITLVKKYANQESPAR